jgi:hypothetical protein
MTWTDERIAQALAELRQPFPIESIQFRIGATAERDGGLIGMALPYADWWTGYLPVLQRVIGPGHWNISLQPWGERRVIAHLTAFDGRLTHWSSGEGEDGDPNGGTSAEAQAKKRVCAEALGLGLYLYSAPKLWGTLEHRNRFAPGEEARLKQALYRQMGLLSQDTPTKDDTPRSRQVAPNSDQLQRARTALRSAEQRVTTRPHAARPSKPATEKQLQAILSLLRSCRKHVDLHRLGGEVGIPALATVQATRDLATLSASTASALISRLQGASQ